MEWMTNTERYIDPKTDFGFKRLFGQENNKELLIHFINSLLNGTHIVKELRYLPMEQTAKRGENRNAVFDVYCRDQHGEAFIVEMQNAYQRSFKARSIFYSTFPIQEGVRKGSRDCTFPPVYTICLLNFSFDEPGDRPFAPEYITWVKLMNINSKRVFFNDLTYIYVELPKFTRSEWQLDSEMDKWLYLLKNASALMERPAALRDRVFTRFFEQAEIAAMDENELRTYRQDRYDLRSYYDSLDSAESRGREKGLEEGMEKGRQAGRQEGILETARKFKSLGVTVAQIQEATGLSADEIANL